MKITTIGIDRAKSVAPLSPLRSVRVLDQLRERICYLQYGLRTEQVYVHWIWTFIRRFNGVQKAVSSGGNKVEAFLSWLAKKCKVSPSTHRSVLIS